MSSMKIRIRQYKRLVSETMESGIQKIQDAIFGEFRQRPTLITPPALSLPALHRIQQRQEVQRLERQSLAAGAEAFAGALVAAALLIGNFWMGLWIASTEAYWLHGATAIASLSLGFFIMDHVTTPARRAIQLRALAKRWRSDFYSPFSVGGVEF